MLQAFTEAVATQIELIGKSASNAIIFIVLFDFLVGYTILNLFGERKVNAFERWLIPILMVVAAWVSIELMEKSQWSGFISY